MTINFAFTTKNCYGKSGNCSFLGCAKQNKCVHKQVIAFSVVV